MLPVVLGLLPQSVALGPVVLVPHLRPQLVRPLTVALQWRVIIVR